MSINQGQCDHIFLGFQRLCTVGRVPLSYVALDGDLFADKVAETAECRDRYVFISSRNNILGLQRKFRQYCICALRAELIVEHFRAGRHCFRRIHAETDGRNELRRPLLTMVARLRE